MNNNKQTKQNNYPYTHTNPNITTVGAFLFANVSTSPISLGDESTASQIESTNGVSAINYEKEAAIFLAYVNNDVARNTNFDLIKSKYTSAEKKQYIAADGSRKGTAKALLLKVGTKLVIPANKVNRNAFITKGIEIVNNNDIAFKADQLAKLEADKGYVHLFKPNAKNASNGITKQTNPNISVWIWCRALSNSNQTDLQGQIFDVTPFVEQIQTNVSKQGGNFSFNLAPITCEKDPNGKWIIKKNTIKFTEDHRYRPEFISNGSLFESDKVDGNSLKRSQFLFHNILSSNDVVFIRFETLIVEDKDRTKNQSNLTLNNSILPNKIYDMIGLVDQNTISVNPTNTDVSIQIGGRDLSKLFIEDGAYFYILFGGEGATKPSINEDDFDLARRLAGEAGSIAYLQQLANASVRDVMTFVIQQLASIRVVPDNLFSAYGDRANVRYVDLPDKNEIQSTRIRSEETDKFKSLAKAGIETARVQNSLLILDANHKIDKLLEDQKIELVYQQLYAFIKKVKTEKALNGTNIGFFDGNKIIGWQIFTYGSNTVGEQLVTANEIPYTIGNEFLFVCDNPTFLLSDDVFGIIENINSVIDIKNLTPNNLPAVLKDKAKGIWQIVKLVIDDQVQKRRLFDISLSTAQGSIVNFFKKVCQEPFVEYYSDTYGDAFYIIARKPPFDRIGVNSLLSGNVNTEKGRNEGQTIVVDIEEYDVISDNLRFDDSEAYSWYHLNPNSTIAGSADAFTSLFIPALFFPEYASIFGSRQCDVTTNYIPWNEYDLNNKDEKVSPEYIQAAHDLKYLVEIGQYLPFVRKGSITINADRRIKIGNIIRYKSTGEIFFVDAVQQTFIVSGSGIERSTVIQVSKGMVEQLIYGVNISDSKTGKLKNCSYFDIINTNLILDKFKTIPVTGRTKTIIKNVANTSGTSAPVLNLKYKGQIVDYRSYGSLNLLSTANENMIQTLAPTQDPDLRAVVQNTFRTFLNKCIALGWQPIITSAFRSHEQQASLYSQNPAGTAKPSTSKHETGLAIDINLFYYPSGSKIYSKSLMKGRGLSEQTYFKQQWLASGIPNIAATLGLIWGGNYTSVDNVHFQFPTLGISGETHQVTEEVALPDGTETILDIDQTFNNFKVDIDVLNFFLRKEQFSYTAVAKRNVSAKNNATKGNNFGDFNTTTNNSSLS